MPLIKQFKKMPKRSSKVYSARSNLVREYTGRLYRQQYFMLLNKVCYEEAEIVKALHDEQGIAIGRKYGTDELATIIDFEIQDTNNQLAFYVIITFDTRREMDLIAENPLNMPPRIAWTSDTFTAPLIQDAYGVPVLTTAGNKMDPIPGIEIKREILTITINQRSYDKTFYSPFKRSLNKDPFLGSPKHYSRINDITANQVIGNGYNYYEVNYEIEFREEPDSFFDFYLDADYRDASGKVFLDNRALMPYQNVTPLNGRGKPIQVAVSALAAGMDASQTTLTITSGDQTLFPPGPRAENADGIVVGPHWYFEVIVQGEIMQVTSVAANVFTVTRGYAGTEAKAHTTGSPVKLLPYYLRYIPKRPKDWTPLNLPTVFRP